MVEHVEIGKTKVGQSDSNLNILLRRNARGHGMHIMRNFQEYLSYFLVDPRPSRRVVCLDPKQRVPIGDHQAVL